MVSILPPNQSAGTLIGQGLGQGLASGIERGGNVGFQRALTREALQGLEQTAQRPGQSPFQLASQLIQATAGIPGAERYVGQLFPYLLTELQRGAAIGQSQGQMQGQPISPSAQMQPQGQASSKQVPQQGLEGGVLPRILTQDEILARASSIPGKGIQESIADIEAQNQLAVTQRKLAEKKAESSGIPSQEIPEFMQVGQQFAGERNLDSWYTKTADKFKEYKSAKDALDRAFIPGIGTGIKEKLKGAFVPSLLLGNEDSRQKAIKNLHPTFKRLSDMGFENYARQKLAGEHLSPAEIAEVAHPIPSELVKSLNSLPQASRFPSAKEVGKLEDFIRKNMGTNVSPLALRNKLWDKGYNWEDIAQAFKNATNPKDLTTWQTTEMTDVESNPPLQSLSEIFREWGRIPAFIRGSK